MLYTRKHYGTVRNKKINIMRLFSIYNDRFFITIAMIFCIATTTVAQFPKITIKKPKITVGSPKISIPTPENLVKNVITVTEVAIEQAGSTAKNIIITTDVAVHQTGNIVEKASADVVAETGRMPSHIIDVGNATVNYISSYGTSTITTITDAEQRIKQGKLLDAFFHVALAPLQAQDDAAFKATQESGWINSAGAVVASVYGGPGGSASYAAWQTYKLSDNNMELAVRAGIIAGLTNAASGAVSKMEPDLVRNVILGGAIGGLAMAASGAEEKDLILGVILGGGMVLVQDAYQMYLGHELDATAPTEPPYCMSLSDPSCVELRDAFTFDKEGYVTGMDPTKLNPNRSHVGIQADVETLNKYLNGGKLSIEEIAKFNEVSNSLDRSKFMQVVAKGPAFNSMGFFHDKWAIDWKMSSLSTKLTIIPAIALTYIGTGTQLYTSIPEKIVASNNQNLASVHKESENNLETTDGINQPRRTGVLAALEEFQNNLDTIGENNQPRRTGVLAALKEFQNEIGRSTDSIVSANEGVEKLLLDGVKPSVGWAWKEQKNANNFSVQKIEGIEVDSKGRIRPKNGWDWVDEKDSFNFEVKKIVGLDVNENSIQPTKGWIWRYPDQADNLEVIKE